MESLYRKYRPLTFDSVVGQQHIVSTLEHAVTEGRLSHAYLFCGPRGTGKTTMARILAKALLCEHAEAARAEGASGCMPDGTCPECEAIAEGTHPDVYELDAASRTGVDSVREEIISSVNFAPVRGAYKVYIIDEVHMLTAAAFNALLKTLEEPPSHVVFILCTTDPQKILETILSRCQRFDFHRISNEDIVGRLRYICEQEGFDADDEALEIVARHARGGMRDALSTLEQLSVFGDGAVRVRDARALLGEVAGTVLADFARGIAARDVVGLFSALRAQVEEGNDLLEFTRDLVAHVRDVYTARVAGARPELFDGTPEEVAALVEEAGAFESADRLARVLTVLDDAAIEMRNASDPRLVLEIACTRLARPESDLTLEALAERLAHVEAQLAAGVPSAPMDAVGLAALTGTARSGAATGSAVRAGGQPTPVAGAGVPVAASGGAGVHGGTAPWHGGATDRVASGPADAGRGATGPAVAVADTAARAGMSGVAQGVAASTSPADAGMGRGAAGSAGAGAKQGADSAGARRGPEVASGAASADGVAHAEGPQGTAADAGMHREAVGASAATGAGQNTRPGQERTDAARDVASGAATASTPRGAAAGSSPDGATGPHARGADDAQAAPVVAQTASASGAKTASKPAEPSAAQVAAAAAASTPAVTDAGELQRRWAEVIKRVTAAQASRGALLQASRATADDGARLTVTFPKGSNFAIKMLGRADSHDLIMPIVAAVFGARTVDYVMDGAAAPSQAPAPAAAPQAAPAASAPATASQDARNAVAPAGEGSREAGAPVTSMPDAPVKAPSAGTPVPGPGSPAAAAANPRPGTAVPRNVSAPAAAPAGRSVPWATPARGAADHGGSAQASAASGGSARQQAAPAAPAPAVDQVSGPTIVPEPDIEADRRAWEDEQVPYDDAAIAAYDDEEAPPFDLPADAVPVSSAAPAAAPGQSAPAASAPKRQVPAGAAPWEGVATPADDETTQVPQTQEEAKELLNSIFGNVIYKTEEQ